MRRHQPALLGGLFIGVLSSLPLVNAANLCCCLWVVTGGMLTAYLQQQARAEPVETGDAVLAGLLAGFIGWVLSTVISIAFVAAWGDMLQERVRMLFDQNPEMPADMRDTMLNLTAGWRGALINALITLPLFSVFGAIGGLLGVALFRKKPTLPPAIQA